MKTVLKLAVQKSGRLSESSLKLIRECGITFNSKISKLKANASNFPVEFLYLRDDDIPRYVTDGIADAGIIGENVQKEKNHEDVTAHVCDFPDYRILIPSIFHIARCSSKNDR